MSHLKHFLNQFAGSLQKYRKRYSGKVQISLKDLNKGQKVMKKIGFMRFLHITAFCFYLHFTKCSKFFGSGLVVFNLCPNTHEFAYMQTNANFLTQ